MLKLTYERLYRSKKFSGLANARHEREGKAGGEDKGREEKERELREGDSHASSSGQLKSSAMGPGTLGAPRQEDNFLRIKSNNY
jgi:hypothetical protein